VSALGLNWSADVLKALEIAALIAGVAYTVLAARRNRLCWIAGAVGSALLALLSGLQHLPMQSGLQVFYVAMSAYGWWRWTHSSVAGELRVGVWPLRWHLAAAACIVLLSFLSAHWLAEKTKAAWPLLDSLTTWFSLLATWLQAHARIENWLYWIAIDGVLVFLFYMQGLPFIALQWVILIGIAAAGYVAWRRRLHAQVVPA
jgi:nicotinamide mononucleotide transporter